MELAHISHQLKLMQNVRRPSNSLPMQPPPLPPPQQRIKMQATEGKVHSMYGNLIKKTQYILGHTVFSQTQLTALKYQIMAYKLLSKDSPLPLNLQQAVLAPFNGLSVESPTTPTIKQTKKPIKPQSPLRSIPQTKIPSRPPYNAYVVPSQLLPKPITSYVHASRQQRLLVPSLTPIGLDTHHILSQREERIVARMQHRIHSHPNDENSMKKIIQIKALKLREKQHKVSSFFFLKKQHELIS